MVRIRNIDESLNFYCVTLGMQEVYRYENEKGRFTNIFLKAADDDVGEAPKEKGMGASSRVAPVLELTYNWPAPTGGDSEELSSGRNPDDSSMASVGAPTLRRGFGHLAYEVENIYDTCARLQEKGVVINRPPRDGKMAFIKSPDGISIELLQKGEPLAPAEPWSGMENTGSW